jgi:hypothetical protein
MRLMFVYWRTGDAGSAQTLYGYAKAAEAMGHEVLLYAPEEPFPVKCSLNLESADAVIFVLEWNMYLHPGELPKNTVRPARPGLMGIGHLNLVRLMNRVPRERRIVIDDDGMYNPITSVEGDFNHTSEEACRLRMETYESLSDKIYQPTLHPVLPNVGSFLFHAYNPALEVPLDFSAKELGMIYVGSNWFRWRPMMRVLRALEQVRSRVGRVCIVGRDWDRVPEWVESPLREQAYYTDPAYLHGLDIDLLPPIPAQHVIATMSRAVFNPVVVRPIFHHFELINPRMFETPAANTIPLFGLNPRYVVEIFGDRARELVLDEHAADKIADVMSRPEYYADIVRGIRRHLAETQSYQKRLQGLIQIIESKGLVALCT